MLYVSANQLRRLSLILTVVYFQDYPVFSIFSLIVQTITMIEVSGLVEPFNSKTSNLVDLINETFSILTLYTLVCFTDFVADKSVQVSVGNGLILAVCSSISFDLMIILAESTYLLIRKLKLGWLKSKQKWAIEEKN